MAFLSPLFLLGALAAAVPVVLHLLRREPEARLKFAAVRMLQHAPVEHADRRRLRQLLLLTLRVAAMLLLALAFARPFLTAVAGATTGVTIVALDTSFSLSAPGRFARAQTLAREAIESAPSGHLVGVVTFADGAQVAQEPSADRALSVAAVDAARVGFGSTRYRAALSTAADAAAGRDGRVVVVTDLQTSGWDRGEKVDLPARLQVVLADIGPAPPNLALTSARRSGERIAVSVRNGGAAARDVRLRLIVDGKPAGEAAGIVAADQSVDILLPPASGTTATVTVDDPEGMQADNARYLTMGVADRPSVLIVTNAGDLGRDAFYAQQALVAAGPNGATYDVAAASGAQMSAWNAARLDQHAAVVLLSTRGLDQRGRELLAGYIRHGAGVFVAAGPDVDAQVASSAVGTVLEFTPLPPDAAGQARTLAPADLRHPVFRPFAADAATLGLVRFRQVVAVRGPGCQPLARFSTGDPALLECTSGEGRALVLASDLDGRGNDFPVHATFVPFLHESIDYLTGGRRPTTGYVVGSTPPGVSPEPGLHTPAGQGRDPGPPVAVNVDARESDVTRLTAEEFQAAVAPLQEARDAQAQQMEARQQEERQNLWRYAILLMVAALVVESLVAARTA